MPQSLFHALNDARGHYRLLFDAHPQPMWVYDLESLYFLAVNDAAIEHYGYSRAEFLRMTIKDMRPAEDWPALEENIHQTALGLRHSGDWRHRLKDGRIILVEIVSNAIDFEGRSARLVIANNVTEQRALEQKLLESEERFRAVSHVTTDVIWDWSQKNDRTWYSDDLEKIFGHSPSEGERGYTFWLDHIHPEDKDRVIQSTNEAIQRKQQIWEDQYRFLRKDGSIAYVEDSAYLIFDSDGAVVRLVGGMSDISERKAAEAKLSQQAALLDKAQDAIVVRDMNDRVLFWNKSAERIYGWTTEEAIGSCLMELLCTDPALLAEPTATVLNEGEWAGEIARRCKDGSSLTVEERWTLVRDDAGKPYSVLSIATDVTKRLALEAQLLQSQRLEAVGQLTGGVAHDFNNLLTVILGNSELLVEQLGEGNPLRLLAEMTMTAAQRGADLTARLLAFSRRQPLEPRIVCVDDLLDRMDGLLRRTLTAHIAIDLATNTNPSSVLIDPGQLEAAVLNLCINARDAMPNGGRLTIETANTYLEQDYADQYPDVNAGEYVEIAISDTGVGISKEDLTRVFEPFFTTKDAGKGTGLGLSMVYGFAKQSGGHVNIYSELGHGTTVKLYLPRIVEKQGPEGDAERQGAEPGSGQTILVVEDEDLVRYHVERQLTALGYSVIAVANGQEALEVVSRETRTDLLFTDIVMPGGINGKQLADEVRRRRPGLAVLFTSGYAESVISHQGHLDPGVSLLSKPYSRVELARKVCEALRVRFEIQG